MRHHSAQQRLRQRRQRCDAGVRRSACRARQRVRSLLRESRRKASSEEAQGSHAALAPARIVAAAVQQPGAT
jgi:hypothetical protein